MNNCLLGKSWALKLVWALNVQNYTILPGTLGMAFTDGECIQDQYGNQYTLRIDETHQYITGTVSGGQGGGPWILTGSYVQSAPADPWIGLDHCAGHFRPPRIIGSAQNSHVFNGSGASTWDRNRWGGRRHDQGPWIYELTVTNTNGTGQPGFVPVFKLKGVQPQGAWYYDSGYGAQEFTFTSCTAVAAMAVAGQERLTPGERRGTRIG